MTPNLNQREIDEMEWVEVGRGTICHMCDHWLIFSQMCSWSKWQPSKNQAMPLVYKCKDFEEAKRTVIPIAEIDL